jgi:hypothetical protein
MTRTPGWAPQYRPERLAARAVDRGAGGVLPAGRQDGGPRTPAQRGVEQLGIGSAPVDRDGLDRESEGVDEVGDARPAGVLDDDPVTRPQRGLQRALDRVERAAGDRDIAGYPVPGELGGCQRGEVGQIRGAAVQLVLGPGAGQRLGKRGQQPRIRVPARQVADPGPGCTA